MRAQNAPHGLTAQAVRGVNSACGPLVKAGEVRHIRQVDAGELSQLRLVAVWVGHAGHGVAGGGGGGGGVDGVLKDPGGLRGRAHPGPRR